MSYNEIRPRKDSFVKHNPFSTRKTAPDRIPFFFGKNSDCSAKNHFPAEAAVENFRFDALYNAFLSYACHAQIIGGHGTGKSTFLAGFVSLLRKNGHEINRITLHDNQRRLPGEFRERQLKIIENFKTGRMTKAPIAVIDGYEQLSWFQKSGLRRFVEKNRCGLLVTVHDRMRHFPVLFQTKPEFEILQQIIEFLFREQIEIDPPDPALCRALFERHRGNIRNVLFDLYDLYEMNLENQT